MNAENHNKRRRYDIHAFFESSEEEHEEYSLPEPSRKLPIRNDAAEERVSNEPKAGVSQPTSNITTAEKECDESVDLLVNCRLRHGLNEDCLCEVFKFLSVYDLIQLCELNVYFQNVIVNRVIGQKLINFTSMAPCWTTNKILQVFGKAMHKIKIASENTLGSFERFLEFVIRYCSVGGLTEAELRFRMPTASPVILKQAMPYFANIRKLILTEKYECVSYNRFLSGLIPVATNLTHLTLDGVNVKGEWLLTTGVDNLRELRLHATEHRSTEIQIDNLAQFLRTKQNLEVFSYIGSVDIRPIVETLIEKCPKLKVFIDFHLKNPYDHAIEDITLRMRTHYNFVQRFRGVSAIGLTSYTQCNSDLYYPLVKLANQNQVEAIKIYMDCENAIVLPESNRMHYSNSAFNHYSCLKSIDLQIKSNSVYKSELHAEFIFEFISQLTNIERLNIIFDSFLSNINRIIESAPHLKCMGIANTKMKYLPVEMRKIVISIRNRRAHQIAMGHPDPPPFHLIVNEQQWRELSIHRDIDTIITSTVKYSVSGRFDLSGA